MLHDFTFRDPAEILAELRGGAGAPCAHAGHGADHSKMDHATPPSAPATAGAMLNDVVYDAYLANERTLDDPETLRVEKGGWAEAAHHQWCQRVQHVGRSWRADG